MSSQVLGEAVWAIRGDMEDLRGTLQEARGSIEEATRHAAQAAARVGKVVAGVGTFMTGSLIGFVTATTATNDELMKMSRQVDWTVESLSAMVNVTQESGIEWERFTRALRRSLQTVDSFVQGSSDSSKALALLGLEFGDIIAMAPEKQFQAIQQALVQFLRSGEDAGPIMRAFNLESRDFKNIQLPQTIRNLTSKIHEFAVEGHDASAALARMGLAASDFQGLNGEEQFMLIFDALSQVTDEFKRSTLAGQVFGTNAGPAMASMLQMSRAELEKAIERGFEYTGITQKQGEAAEAFQDALNRLKNAFVPLMNVITDALVGPMQDMVDWLRESIQDISAWVGENQELVQTVLKVAFAVGGLMMVVGPMLMMLPGLVSLVAMVKGAFVLLGPVILGVGAVIGMVAGWIIANWDSVKEAGETLWAKLQPVFEEFKESLLELWDSVKDLGMSLFELGKDMAPTVIKALSFLGKAVLPPLIFGLKGLIAYLNNVVQTFDMLVNVFSWGWNTILKPVLDAIWDMLNTVGGTALNFLFGGEISARAEGGPVEAGRPYVVGERGPELFVPQSAGSIAPNAGGGGGIGGDLHIEFSGPMNVRSDQDVQDLSRRLASDIKGELGYAL